MSSTSAFFSPTCWRWCRFDDLTVHELQLIHRARQQVFVVEQRCPYVDADGCDEHAFHLAARAPGQPSPIAYARVVDPGFKYPEPSIGRVLTAATGRGRGLGRELVARAVAQTIEAFPGQGIRISAQSHLEAFYRSFGFAGVGECYLEDGIPHIEMLRPG
ncbi:MAG: GNAT family N-acetyltransferase [Burkholderiaceae bacterium]|nr:GNAT family N-acetyltransferase [Burkholderiaceae bacterium]